MRTRTWQTGPRESARGKGERREDDGDTECELLRDWDDFIAEDVHGL